MLADDAFPLAFSLPRHAATIAIATALVASGVGLAFLWRTRLSRAATWKKCAVASLWVHLVLACLATMVRMYAGPGSGDGEPGPPVRVALVDDSSPEDAESSVVANEPPADEPAWSESLEAPPLAPPAPPLPEQEPSLSAEELAVTDAAADLEPAPAWEAPSLLTPPTPPQTRRARDGSPEESDDPSQRPAPTDQATLPSTPAHGVPADYADRFVSNRLELVKAGGGSEQTEQAVQQALAWLARTQNPDGSWDPARYGAGRERFVLGHDRGGAGARADTGVGALALLALLGGGHDGRGGEHAVRVRRGVDYLRRVQRPNGDLAGQAELFARTYCHSMATFALAEAQILDPRPEVFAAVRSATAYSLAIQHPTDGGWRYRPGDTGDTSQLGWQVMALRSAELAGANVPPATWTRIERFLRTVERGVAGGLAAYRPEGPPTRPMTAEALYCRLLMQDRGGSLTPAAIDEACQSLLAEPPRAQLQNFYCWYYATLTLHHAQQATPNAAEAWREWNQSLIGTLLATQDADGSWPPNCLWGGYGGRVYTTALGALCLEIYYRYAPPAAVATGEVARRGEWRSVRPQ